MKIGPGVFELWRVENRPLRLTWPMAYTKACTIVQAVIGLWCKYTVLFVFLLGVYVGRADRPSTGVMSTTFLVITLLLSCIVGLTTAARCNGVCQACVRRYGCMTLSPYLCGG